MIKSAIVGSYPKIGLDAAIDDQIESGIDIITDGEQGRDHYIHGILRKLKGFDYDNQIEKTVRKQISGVMRNAYKTSVPTLTGKIRHGKKVFLLDEYIYVSKKTDKNVKVTLPGPTTVVDFCNNNRVYKSTKKLAFDYARAIREEVLWLKNLGCKLIQFDDPGLLRNLKRAEEWGIEALDRCFKGVLKGSDVTTIVHVCRSYPGVMKSDQNLYSELLKLLQDSKIDQIGIEAKTGALDLSALENLGDKTINLGCIDVGLQRVESVEEITDRAKEALKYIDPEQLVLTPDCGLLQLDRETAKAKLTNLSKAAKRL